MTYLSSGAYPARKPAVMILIFNELQRIALFFEQLENKNEENTLDLAGVYFLIGQLF